jgi:hypothetical protein
MYGISLTFATWPAATMGQPHPALASAGGRRDAERDTTKENPMTGKTIRLAAVVSALVLAIGSQLVVQLAGARPAAAVPGLTRIESASGYNLLSPKTQTAYCPPDTVVVGGGGFAGDDDADNGLRLTGLLPIHTDRGDKYVVTAESRPGFAKPWVLVAYAICAAPLPGYEITAATTDVSPRTFKVTAARCPSG